MQTVAFALRADHEDFSGGSFAWGAGPQTFDVGRELQEGNGVITVEVPDEDTELKHLLVAALDDYPALRRVSLKSAPEVQEKSKQDSVLSEHDLGKLDRESLTKLSDEEVRDIAEKLIGEKPKKSAAKTDVVQSILDHQKGGTA